MQIWTLYKLNETHIGDIAEMAHEMAMNRRKEAWVHLLSNWQWSSPKNSKHRPKQDNGIH